MLLEGELMKIILVKTGTFPCIMNVPHELAFLQALVGGNIEVVEPFDDDVILVCNECGRNEGRPVNRVINNHMDICGDFFLCGQDEYGLSDIPEEKITPYLDRFQLYPAG